MHIPVRGAFPRHLFRRRRLLFYPSNTPGLITAKIAFLSNIFGAA
jgi:hypothetical protein